MPTLTVSSRPCLGLFAVSFSQLAVSVNVFYLHFNLSVTTNGHAYVTGGPSGRWYSSGEVWNEK